MGGSLPAEYDYATWTARWTGGLSAEITGRDHTLHADEPEEFGGADSGPMPTEILTASLASCFCMALAWSAKRRNVELTEIEVDVRPERPGQAPRLGAFDVWVRASAPPDVLAPLVDLAKRVCWVSNTLANPPEIRYHLD